MASTQAVWGIDVGQAALKAIKLRAGDDGVELLAYDVIEHAKILSWADADVETLTRNALEKFIQGNPDAENDTIVISVPGNLTFSKFVTLPPVEPDKIPDIIRFEATQQIPFPINEVVWDYEVLTGPDAPEQKAGIFCIKREDVYTILNHYKTLKPPLNIELVQAAPLALFNFMNYDGQMGEGTTVLLNIGAETSDLIISDGEQIVLRNIPLGGNSFTKALVESFKLPYPKAENLKKTAASSKHAKQIFQAMRPVFADFAGELQRTIARFQAQNRESEVTKVIGLGNAFLLPGLQKYLEQHLNVPVVKVEKFNKVRPGETVNTPKFAENVLSFGVAYGLAVQGLGLARLQSNLVPPEVQSEKRWNTKKPWFAAATGLLAAGLSLILVPRVSQTNELTQLVKAQKPVVDKTLAAVKAADAEFAKKIGEPEEDFRAAVAFLAPIEQREINRIIYEDVMAAVEKVNKQQFDEWARQFPEEFKRRTEGQATPFLDAAGLWEVKYRTKPNPMTGKLEPEFDEKTGQALVERMPGKPLRNAAKLVQLKSVTFTYHRDIQKAFDNKGGPAATGGAAGGFQAVTVPNPAAGATAGGTAGAAAAAPAGEPGYILEIVAATTAGCATEPGGANADPLTARTHGATALANALKKVDVGLGRSYEGKTIAATAKDAREHNPLELPQAVSAGGGAGANAKLEDYGFVFLRGDGNSTAPTYTAAEENDLRMRWLPVGEYEGDQEFRIRMKIPLNDVVDYLNNKVYDGKVSGKPFRLPGLVNPPAPAAGTENGAPATGAPAAKPAGT